MQSIRSPANSPPINSVDKNEQPDDPAKLAEAIANLERALKGVSRRLTQRALRAVCAIHSVTTDSVRPTPPVVVNKVTKQPSSPQKQVSKKSDEEKKIRKDIKDINAKIAKESDGSPLPKSHKLIISRDQLFRDLKEETNKKSRTKDKEPSKKVTDPETN